MRDKSIHGQWSSQIMFIFAAAGSAVGLGNIWKFPYITAENGGGAFVLVYLICIFAIGMPVMMSEVLLGKWGKRSPINSMRDIARQSKRSSLWQGVGWMGVLAGFLILSYYSVIAGWAMAYVPKLALGTFTEVNALSQPEIVDYVGNIFGNLVSNPWQLTLWHTLFMMSTMFVIAGGVENGLERALRFMMPALFTLLLLLVGYAMNTDKFMDGVHFLFDVNFEKLFYPNGCTENSCEFSGKPILAAMGQAFFTLSLGMGAIMAYGAYLPKHSSITRTTAAVVLADTFVALLAGLAIFPIIFSNGLDVDQGVGLVFKSLPIAFGKMPAGTLFGTLFFVLIVLAAWSSAISLIEPTVAWLVETGKFTRTVATFVCGIGAWLLGFVTIFSFNIWSDVQPLSMFSMFEGKSLFDLLDFLTSNVMLPVGGLLMAVFVGWRLKTSLLTKILEMPETHWGYKLWHFLVRFVTPVGVTLIFLNAIGLF